MFFDDTCFVTVVIIIVCRAVVFNYRGRGGASLKVIHSCALSSLLPMPLPMMLYIEI